jgi:hypothetical protein
MGMALGNCRGCGKEVSDGAKICPNCGIKTPIRKSVTLIQAVIVIFIGAWIISKMGGMLGFEHTASITTASVTPKVSSISVDSLYVNGKEIQIGDTDDQVFKLLTKDQLVSQTEEKDPNNALSLLVVKHIQVNGKKFAVYFSRVQDPEPYKVTKIIENTASVTTSVTSKVSSIPNVPKKDGTYDARTNDLEELCRDYIFFRNRIIKYTREGDEKAANKARADFQQTNRWLEAYNEKDMNDMFTRIGDTK